MVFVDFSCELLKRDLGHYLNFLHFDIITLLAKLSYRAGQNNDLM